MRRYAIASAALRSRRSRLKVPAGSAIASELSTAKLLTILEQALQVLDGDSDRGRAVHTLFGNQVLET